MFVRQALMLELRVAFSRKGPPIWIRVLKWMVLLLVGAYLWRESHVWWWIGSALGLGVTQPATHDDAPRASGDETMVAN